MDGEDEEGGNDTDGGLHADVRTCADLSRARHLNSPGCGLGGDALPGGSCTSAGALKDPLKGVDQIFGQEWLLQEAGGFRLSDSIGDH